MDVGNKNFDFLLVKCVHRENNFRNMHFNNKNHEHTWTILQPSSHLVTNYHKLFFSYTEEIN